mmetsp:Transcript_25749/g.60118  ORF Transcript_25749/g.60118 Transcript_25749/m.60118 type:complete len:279 (-) Transcript_25749:168-1004(-)
MLTMQATDVDSKVGKCCFRLGEDIPEAACVKRPVRRQVFALGEVVPNRQEYPQVPETPTMLQRVPSPVSVQVIQTAPQAVQKPKIPSSGSAGAPGAQALECGRATSSASTALMKLTPAPPTAVRRTPRRIVFLDVDGVLHAAHNATTSFAPWCMKVLAEIVNTTGAEIVLSSSWRLWAKGVGRAAVDAALVKHGMAKTIGQTPSTAARAYNSNSRMRGRAAEIVEWLHTEAQCHPEVRWVVLDDMDMTEDVGSHMILTDPLSGLQRHNAEQAIAELMR